MDRQSAFARFRDGRWLALVWAVPAAIALAVAVVLAARGLRTTPAARDFLAQFPGTSALPMGAPVGFPAWLAVQHFLNALFVLFILRTGWQLRAKARPSAFWTRNNTRRLRTRHAPTRIGMPLWFHLSLDALWVANGLVYLVLLFSTGQWMRLVPLRWDLIPNALSAALQYVSFDWPTENGWINYNALQQLAYFATVFIAAPLALGTGLRLSPGLARTFHRLDPILPLATTRTAHTIVMIWFAVFIAAHVTLVLATGALRNLNHMYAGRDDGTWWGVGVFAASVVVMVLAWFAARPSVLAVIAGRFGTVRR